MVLVDSLNLQRKFTGIGTSMKNLANSSIKGLASMIEAFDSFIKALTGKNIDQHIDSLKNIINGGFNAINSVIKAGIPLAENRSGVCFHR